MTDVCLFCILDDARSNDVNRFLLRLSLPNRSTRSPRTKPARSLNISRYCSLRVSRGHQLSLFRRFWRQALDFCVERERLSRITCRTTPEPRAAFTVFAWHEIKCCSPENQQCERDLRERHPWRDSITGFSRRLTPASSCGALVEENRSVGGGELSGAS